MRKLVLYIATSLNGKIAKSDGSVNWLENMPNPNKLDYGYQKFYKKVGTTIQGFNTYRQIIDWGIPFPYADKENFVFTRKKDLKRSNDVRFVTENHLEFTKELKEKRGKDIWLIGGGQINTLLFNAGLIDEIRVFVMPIVIPKGIELFESIPKEKLLKLIDIKAFPTGVVEMIYEVNGLT